MGIESDPFFQGAISGAIGGVFATAAIAASRHFYKEFRTVVDQEYRNLRDLPESEYRKLKLAKSILLQSDSDVRLAPGSNHFIYGSNFHPDDQLAFIQLNRSIAPMAQTIQIDHPEGLKSGLVDGQYVCLGSPMSNSRSRAYMQYLPDNNESATEMKRSENPILELPFQFIFEKKRLEDIKATFVSPKGNLRYNWAIEHKGVAGGLFIPRTDGLRVDYLLISKLPNWLESRPKLGGFYNSVCLLSGCHGAATVASSLLFDRLDLLAELERKTKDFSYWQALYEVSDIEMRMHPVLKEDRPMPGSAGRLIAVEPVRLRSFYRSE